MKLSILSTVVAVVTLSYTKAFVPTKLQRDGFQRQAATQTDIKVAEKPTGTSFLPEETVERAKAGNPIEKNKIAKDPIHSWVDVYEYARKIREGEMTWEEVEKADLDCVSHKLNFHESSKFVDPKLTVSLIIAPEICWYASQRKAHSRSIHDASQGPEWNCQLRPNEILC